MNIVVLGANGQLGTDVMQVLSLDAEHHVTPMTRVDLDLESFAKDAYERTVLDSIDFDCMINCTSYHKTDECEDNPIKTYTINSVAVGELAKICQRKGSSFIHISTDYVFDGWAHTPYDETGYASPLNIYGASKLAGESMALAYCDRTTVLRVSSLFGRAGASGKGGNFVETMLRLAAEGKALQVVDDQIMSPTHTLDIARAIQSLLATDLDKYGLFHCSGEGACSWFEFAKEIFAILGRDVVVAPVRHDQFPTKAKRPAYSVLDNGKLSKIHKMPTWKVALRDYLQIKGYIN